MVNPKLKHYDPFPSSDWNTSSCGRVSCPSPRPSCLCWRTSSSPATAKRHKGKTLPEDTQFFEFRKKTYLRKYSSKCIVYLYLFFGRKGRDGVLLIASIREFWSMSLPKPESAVRDDPQTDPGYSDVDGWTVQADGVRGGSEEDHYPSPDWGSAGDGGQAQGNTRGLEFCLLPCFGFDWHT